MRAVTPAARYRHAMKRVSTVAGVGGPMVADCSGPTPSDGTTDANSRPWNGVIDFSKDIAKEDVYIYVATILDVYGVIHNRTGRVSLIR